MSSGLALEAEGGRWKRHPAYRDSGVEWLGAVPEGWEIIRVKLLEGNDTSVVQTGPFGAQLHASDYLDDGVPLILIRNVRDLKIDETDIPRVSEEDAERLSMYRLNIGDIVFSRVGSIGRIALCTERENGWLISGQMLRLRIQNPVLDSVFSLYAFSSESVLTFVELQSVGSTRESINTDILRNMPIPIPPLPEQRIIAAFLNRETGRIDALIAKKEWQVELLREKRTALISHAVTKGLDPDAPTKDSGVEWLGEVPEHWESVRLKWVAKMESGHTPNKKVPEYWANCDIPWVSLNDTAYLREHDYIEDTNYRINELGLANSSARLLPSRAVVFTRDATIGLSAITTRPMAVSQHIIAWLCEPRIVPEYLLRVFYAMAQEFERLTMGSTIKTIGMPDVNELKTPVPPLDEQISIVKYVLGNTDRIDMALVAVLDSINLLREYRTALISAAVTGKIDVREELVS